MPQSACACPLPAKTGLHGKPCAWCLSPAEWAAFSPAPPAGSARGLRASEMPRDGRAHSWLRAARRPFRGRPDCEPRQVRVRVRPELAMMCEMHFDSADREPRSSAITFLERPSVPMPVIRARARGAFEVGAGIPAHVHDVEVPVDGVRRLVHRAEGEAASIAGTLSSRPCGVGVQRVGVMEDDGAGAVVDRDGFSRSLILAFGDGSRLAEPDPTTRLSTNIRVFLLAPA